MEINYNTHTEYTFGIIYIIYVYNICNITLLILNDGTKEEHKKSVAVNYQRIITITAVNQ